MLHIEIDGEHVDVNVHPTKMELRFNNQQEVYNTIYAAIDQGLHEKQLIPHVEMPEPKEQPLLQNQQPKPQIQKQQKAVVPPPQERNLDYFMGKMKERVMAEYAEKKAAKSPVLREEKAAYTTNSIQGKNNGGQKNCEKQIPRQKVEEIQPSVTSEKKIQVQNTEAEKKTEPIVETPKQMELFEDKLLTREAMQKYKIIGQVFETYWLVEYENSLYIIDQHAAHERVLYEKTLKSMKTREFTSQMISPPIVLTLSMQESELLKMYMDQFTRIGFEIEEFGQDSYAVRAVPDNLFSIAKKDLLMEMLDSLSDEIKRNLSPDLIDEKIASMSCKAAVKGNMKLSAQEVDALIGELLSLDNPYHCPHGRPTIIAMTKRELEKKFKRIV